MKVLGVCGGNGVVLHPFKKYLIANLEPRAIFHTRDEEQWVANFGDIPIYKHLFPETLLTCKPDIIVGAPDCGHSSIFALSRGKKFSDPKDNQSLNLYIAQVLRHQPDLFLMENLPNLLNAIPRHEWRKLFKKHRLYFHVGPVTMYGNSQVNRVRLVIIGVKKSSYFFKSGLSSMLKEIPNVENKRTSGELLEGLPFEDISMGQVRESLDEEFAIHAGKKINGHEARKYWEIHFDKSRWYTEEGYNFDTAPGVYRNLNTAYPATARKSNRQYRHDGFMMSPRELARLQDIPDDFKLYVSQDRLNYWINKCRATVAKTPPYNVSKWFLDTLLSTIPNYF